MRKILIVDDDKATRLALKKMVEVLGFEILQSPDGEHALETLKSEDKIALVIADMVMPKKDGRWLIKSMQADEDLKKLPVIIISSVFGVKDIADLLESGARAFVAKPANPDEIHEYVNRYA
jgi:CheY-like chemotaxis protein